MKIILKSAVGPMNSSKNKLNSKISLLKIIYPNTHEACVWIEIKIKIILLFNLFLLLFIGLIALFGIIHGLHCTISTNFYLYL